MIDQYPKPPATIAENLSGIADRLIGSSLVSRDDFSNALLA